MIHIKPTSCQVFGKGVFVNLRSQGARRVWSRGTSSAGELNGDLSNRLHRSSGGRNRETRIRERERPRRSPELFDSRSIFRWNDLLSVHVGISLSPPVSSPLLLTRFVTLSRIFGCAADLPSIGLRRSSGSSKIAAVPSLDRAFFSWGGMIYRVFFHLSWPECALCFLGFPWNEFWFYIVISCFVHVSIGNIVLIHLWWLEICLRLGIR